MNVYYFLATFVLKKKENPDVNVLFSLRTDCEMTKYLISHLEKEKGSL